MKKQAVMFLALLSQSLGLTYADNLTETRGIGQYPGRPSQFTAPKMVKDQTYRNIALNRMVYTFHASIGWDWITNTPGREIGIWNDVYLTCLLYTSPSPRDRQKSRMPSSA